MFSYWEVADLATVLSHRYATQVMRVVCPMCRKVLEQAPEDYPARPFCSERCRLADLSNWLNETYRIPQPLSEQDLDDSLLH